MGNMKESEKAALVIKMEDEMRRQVPKQGILFYEDLVAQLTNDLGGLTLESRGLLISTIVHANRVGQMTHDAPEATIELGRYVSIIVLYIRVSQEAIAFKNKAENTEKAN